MIYSKIRGEGLTAPPSPLPQRKPPAAKFASQSDAHVKTDAEIKFLYYPLYIYIYTEYIYIYIYIYNHLVTLNMCFIMLYLKIEFTYRK